MSLYWQGDDKIWSNFFSPLSNFAKVFVFPETVVAVYPGSWKSWSPFWNWRKNNTTRKIRSSLLTFPAANSCDIFPLPWWAKTGTLPLFPLRRRLLGLVRAKWIRVWSMYSTTQPIHHLWVLLEYCFKKWVYKNIIFSSNLKKGAKIHPPRCVKTSLL